jgi:glyoxylase-like metal-dependent hydrolase (beta-lactamase superfamily II)
VGAGLTAAALPLVARSARAQQQPAPPPQLPRSVSELAQVAPDAYMYRYIGHNALFVVTGEGVIATDPIGLSNPRSPMIYKAAIESVTDQPVRYVVYGFDHQDHAAGGSIFADTAEFVSHTLAAPKIDARNAANTPTPTLLFEEYGELTLGGKTIQLHYAGRNSSDNSLAILHPAEKVLFTTHIAQVRSVPFRTLPDAYPEEWIASLKWVEDNLDFTTLVSGHGPLGTKTDVTAYRNYFEDIIAAVRSARASGMADNAPEMVESVRAALAPRYAAWNNFAASLAENIQGITREVA